MPVRLTHHPAHLPAKCLTRCTSASQTQQSRLSGRPSGRCVTFPPSIACNCKQTTASSSFARIHTVFTAAWCRRVVFVVLFAEDSRQQVEGSGAEPVKMAGGAAACDWRQVRQWLAGQHGKHCAPLAGLSHRATAWAMDSTSIQAKRVPTTKAERFSMCGLIAACACCRRPRAPRHRFPEPQARGRAPPGRPGRHPVPWRWLPG